MIAAPEPGPWHGAGPELTIAGVAVAAAALAGYAVAGAAGLGVVAIAAAALALVVLRGLLPRPGAEATRKARDKEAAQAISGYSHRRFIVANGISNPAFYEAELRPVLEHLLAARLAERHGINLYQDPSAARRLLCRNRRDEVLWQWIDPAHAEARERVQSHGIPSGVLARIINRLEHL
jgi:hypothetical protein